MTNIKAEHTPLPAPSIDADTTIRDTLHQQIINEEYKKWHRSIPYNYDLLVTHALSWPSLSCQWFPNAERYNEGTIQNILLTTHTSEKDCEYLLIAQANIPDSDCDDMDKECEDGGDKYVCVTRKVAVVHEINRARYNPFENDIIALRTDYSDIPIYDLSKYCEYEESGKGPAYILKGHKMGGFGISWNSFKKEELLSSGVDGIVCLYDINANECGSKSVYPMHRFNEHECSVGDCTFSTQSPNLFVSVGDDKKIILYDSRIMKSVEENKNGHYSDINCVNFSPGNTNVFATGGKDGRTNIWDLRNIHKKVHSLFIESNDVLQIQWSPHFENIIATSGTNRRVYIWDINKINKEELFNDDYLKEGPPELKFIHAGHTNPVCDINWNPIEPLEICSVAEDNIVQIWQIKQE